MIKSCNRITPDKPLNKSSFLFGYLFESDKHNFILDLHTNRIFYLENTECELIKKYLDGDKLENLSNMYPQEISEFRELQNEGLFCNIAPRGLEFGMKWENIFDKILHERERTVIEITQQCNLRCKYCTFGGGFIDHRHHTSKVIDDETLTQTVESAFSHSDRLDEISIGFYGGEPLCAFDKIKKAVTLANRKNSTKKIRFSLTTNATLMNKEKADFFKKYGFSIIVSLDGPKYIHDHYRVYPDGRGSYSDTINGLKILLDTYPPNMQHKISINMVVPSFDWIQYLEQLWEDEPWIPSSIRARVSLMNISDILYIEKPKHNTNNLSFRDDWMLSVKDEKIQESILAKDIFDKPLAKLHKRNIFSGYRNTFFPNGCCIPGVRKIFVGVDGVYRICERVHGVPSIGSIKTGVDLLQIKRIVDEYCSLSFSDCKNCFAIANCNLCYQHAYESNKFSIDKKREFCKNKRESLRKLLKTYAMISNSYPHKLDEWDAIKIK
ncbi:radical SAM protein [Vallitalea sediminicola]